MPDEMEAAKEELRLYLYNTSELYGQHQAIIRNLRKKVAKGTYSPELAPKLWRHWINEGAKRYCTEFGGVPRRTFPGELRDALARELAEDERKEIELGSYS